jgi:nucleoid-associated protein YgaU
VQLTRRGRFVLVLGLALVVLVAMVSLSLGSVNATTDAPQDVVTHVTVQPGETLWQIAGRVAPDADPRDTVSRIMALNGLRDARVLAGQDLVVPAAR